jgi:hypothetical protein
LSVSFALHTSCFWGAETAAAEAAIESYVIGTKASLSVSFALHTSCFWDAEKAAAEAAIES